MSKCTHFSTMNDGGEQGKIPGTKNETTIALFKMSQIHLEHPVYKGNTEFDHENLWLF